MSGGFIVLRDYQNDFIRFFLRHMQLPDAEQQYLLSSPTGSGKSVMVQALISYLIQGGVITHALVAAPQIQIEQGFLFGRDAKGRVIKGSQRRIRSYKGDLTLHPSKWVAKRHNTKRIRTFLSHPPRGKQAVVVVTTHKALTDARKRRDLLPASLTNRLLVVDEAHRAGVKNLMGPLITEWLDRGGRVLYVTATPFRTSGDSIIPETACQMVRTMAEHADGVHAPAHLHVEALPLSLEAKSSSEYNGDTLAQGDRDLAATEVGDLWIRDGKPKAVIIVPAKDSDEWSSHLARTLTEKGARVYNAVGADKDPGALTELLQQERSVSNYSDSVVDVILACRRFDEGTDWPLCSHVYNIQIPGAFLLILQRWGRAMRGKYHIKGFPAEHAGSAKITFLVPRVSDQVWTKFKSLHKDHVFLLACFLHDFKVASEYQASSRWRPEDVNRSRSGSRRKDALDQDLMAVLGSLGAPHKRVKALRDVVLVEQALRDLDQSPTLGNVLRYATDTLRMPPDQVQAIKDLWGFRLLAPDLLAKIKARIQRKGSDTASVSSTLIRESLREAFDEVIEAHENVVIDGSASVRKYVGDLTGQRAQAITKDMRERLPRPDLTREDVLAAVVKFYGENP